jgi:hypothetical protein
LIPAPTFAVHLSLEQVERITKAEPTAMRILAAFMPEPAAKLLTELAERRERDAADWRASTVDPFKPRPGERVDLKQAARMVEALTSPKTLTRVERALGIAPKRRGKPKRKPAKRRKTRRA